MEAVITKIISDDKQHLVAVKYPNSAERIVIPIEAKKTLEDYQAEIVALVTEKLNQIVEQQQIGEKLKESMVGQIIKIESIKPMPPIEVLPEDIVVGKQG